MANNNTNCKTINILDSEILCLEDLNQVIKNYFKTSDFNIETYAIKPASEGLIGFLAEHYRMTIVVNLTSLGGKKELHLFLKVVHKDDKAKTKFIRENFFNKREAIMYNVFLKEFGGSEEPHPWRVPVLLCNEDIIVMEDLAARSFAPFNKLNYMDFDHCSTVLQSIARLHAGSVNYEAIKTLESGQRYSIPDQHAYIIEETVFKDCAWMRAGVRSLINCCGTLSEKYGYHSIHFPLIENLLMQSFLDICENLKAYKEYPNVIIHRDLWANNILFRYDQVGKPMDAVLVDFQCIRYVPGVFDVAMFLYLGTDEAFRDTHKRELLDIYYDTFMFSIKYKEFGSIPIYSKEVFLKSYELAKAFGMVSALLILPIILMDAKTSKDVFDDPVTYDDYMYVDRSAPMIEYARKCPLYKSRIINIMDEFVERYIIVTD